MEIIAIIEMNFVKLCKRNTANDLFILAPAVQ